MAQGIWQATDHQPVPLAEAAREWTLRATEILAEVAGRYGRTIQYADLGAEAQRRAGILTDLPFESWLDNVLQEVGRRCTEAGKPALTLLVADPAVRVDPSARASVYEAYGAKLPGAKRGRAATTSSAPRTRSSASRAATGTPRKRTVKPEERRRPICPTCFMELPSTGVCDNCD